MGLAYSKRKCYGMGLCLAVTLVWFTIKKIDQDPHHSSPLFFFLFPMIVSGNGPVLKQIHEVHQAPSLTFDLLPSRTNDKTGRYRPQSYVHRNPTRGKWIKVTCVHSDCGPRLEVYEGEDDALAVEHQGRRPPSNAGHRHGGVVPAARLQPPQVQKEGLRRTLSSASGQERQAIDSALSETLAKNYLLAEDPAPDEEVFERCFPR